MCWKCNNIPKSSRLLNVEYVVNKKDPFIIHMLLLSSLYCNLCWWSTKALTLHVPLIPIFINLKIYSQFQDIKLFFPRMFFFNIYISHLAPLAAGEWFTSTSHYYVLPGVILAALSFLTLLYKMGILNDIHHKPMPDFLLNLF